MAVRPIDANAMLSELRPVSFEAEHSAVLLSDVSKMMREWVERQPTLTPPNEWVSVDDRLPEKRGEYIVCACDEGEPIDERIWGDTVVICADYYDGTFTWYEGDTEYDISDIVTHWIPLPAPPKSRPPKDRNGR